MFVQKFGGTSLASTTKLAAVAKIISETAQSTKTAVVLSAMGKVTDDLIEIIELAIKDEQWQSKLQQLEKFHQNTLIELNCACRIEAQKQQISIKYLFQEAQAKLKGVALLGQCPDDIYAWLITLGEQLSVSIMHTQLLSIGINVEIIDALKALSDTSSIGDTESKIQTLIEKTDLTNELNTKILEELVKLNASNVQKAVEAYE